MEFIFADRIEDVLSAAIPELGEHFVTARRRDDGSLARGAEERAP
jgi:hypothetical protein